MKHIGKNIKSIRKTKGLTQEALAEALYVTRQTVSNYENGRSQPDLDTLLKIAEVLETDINAIIYGPPVPQCKKLRYRWLAVSGSILLVIAALYVALNILFPKQSVFGYHYSMRLLVRLTVLPTLLFVFGWVLMHCLSVFCGLRQLRPEKGNVLRIVAWTLLSLLILIPMPLCIYSGIAGYRSFVHHSVSMRFPYVPVYQQVLEGIVFVIFHIPFVYAILGSCFWLLGLPNMNRQNESGA